jgi:hypothetical protein
MSRILPNDPARLRRWYLLAREVLVWVSAAAVLGAFVLLMVGQEQIRDLSDRYAADEQRKDVERAEQERRAEEAGARALAIARTELARHDAQTRASLEQIVRAVMAELFEVENRENGGGRRIVYIRQTERPPSRPPASQRPKPPPSRPPSPSPSSFPPCPVVVCP